MWFPIDADEVIDDEVIYNLFVYQKIFEIFNKYYL